MDGVLKTFIKSETTELAFSRNSDQVINLNVMFSLDVFDLCRWLWCEDTDDGILIIENFYISKFSF